MENIKFYNPKYGMPNGLYTYQQLERAGYITITNKQLREYFIKSKLPLILFDNHILTYGDILVDGVYVSKPLVTTVKHGYISKGITDYDMPILLLNVKKDSNFVIITLSHYPKCKRAFLENVRIVKHGNCE